MWATTWRKLLSVATSRSTLTLPSASARRVHSVIALGVGSPDMTPSEKRPPRASAAGARRAQPGGQCARGEDRARGYGAGAHDELAAGLHFIDLLSVLRTARA